MSAEDVHNQLETLQRQVEVLRSAATPPAQDQGPVLEILEAFRRVLAGTVKAEAALRDSEARQQAVLQTAVDGIITIDARGSVASFNPAAERLFGYSADEVLGHNVNMLMPSPDREAHDGYLARYLQTGERKIIGIGREVRARRRDGTTFPVRLAVSEMRLDGRRMFTGIIHDLTARVQAEEALRQAQAELEQRVQERTSELESAHKQLVEMAHRAGMAEIASGVLHNIGNSLNSLVVATEGLTRDVDHLPVKQLKKSAQLLSGAGESLAGLPEKDSRVRMLPEYLDKLGDKLGRDAEHMLVELRSMKTNLEQIGATIQVQQAYASGPRLVEQVDVEALVEDALRMQQSSLTRHQVVIERDMARLPVVALERNKALHLLVNLISNAKQALLDAGQADKRIRIEARPCAAGRFVLVVRDNGVGIAESDLQRVFQYGFTTRQGSLGYGLHWAANTAREMGGTLVAASEGRGRGASFILELPLGGPAPVDPPAREVG